MVELNLMTLSFLSNPGQNQICHPTTGLTGNHNPLNPVGFLTFQIPPNYPTKLANTSFTETQKSRIISISKAHLALTNYERRQRIMATLTTINALKNDKLAARATNLGIDPTTFTTKAALAFAVWEIENPVPETYLELDSALEDAFPNATAKKARTIGDMKAARGAIRSLVDMAMEHMDEPQERTLASETVSLPISVTNTGKGIYVFTAPGIETNDQRAFYAAVGLTLGLKAADAPSAEALQ